MNTYSKKNLQRGVVAFYLTIVVMVVALAFVTSIITTTVNQQRILQDITFSSQAYYTAEAGVEDALLRLQNSMNWASPYSFDVGNASTTVTISPMIGGVRIIDAEGDATSRVRKIRTVYQLDSQGTSFNFGAQIGDGGMEMRSGSQITGNVFSNKTVFRGGGGTVTVTETVIVARNGNKIDGLTIGQDADVHTCTNSAITGTLRYVSGGSPGNCTAGTTEDRGPNEIDPQPFPITPQMITDWKADAEAGGTTIGDVTISGNASLGPRKIDGNLIVDTGNCCVLTLTGTVWVTGTLEIKNNATIEVDPGYGDLSGVVIADGNVFVRNGAALRGTSSPASFLLVTGTSASIDEGDPAMEVKNNAAGAILFTPNGLMVIDNLVDVVEATAYQLLLKPNATVTYDVGLTNVLFSSGPSAGWAVTRWTEVE